MPTFVGGTAAAVAVAAVAALALERARRRSDGVNRTGVHVEYVARAATKHAPCVVMEAGANSWSPVWRGAAASLAADMRTFSYDRPGYGRSALTDTGRGTRATARRLVALLRATDTRAPYVLVAHSLGALYVNEAVRLLGADVLGIVYVDAASLETVRLLRGVVPASVPPSWLARSLSALGVLRLLAPVALSPYASVFRKSPLLWREAQATWATHAWLMAYTGEWVDAMRNVDEKYSAAVGQWLGDLPISVIVPDVYERTEGKEFVGAMQRILASYSSDARLVHVKNCGHFVQIERPDVVVDAVRDVVRRAQRRRTAVRRHKAEKHHE